ncbi:MAG TPA: TIGR02281 family clan AA aspartic protease [Allosphingosinicella sp.]|jgi:aspartyl protease family protein|nr:TIGR02281 family clan AA aspartic protease [Allosphingosinicella sp.]
MEKSFLFVIALGAAIGLMLPASHRAAPATPSPAFAKTVTVAASDDPGPPMAVETKLERAPNGHFYADGNVNGQPVRLVVDTGASTVALTMADAQRIGVPFSPNEFTVIGTGASGPVRGESVTLDRVEVGGKEVRGVRAAVVEGLDVSLLGQTYLGRISSVQMSGDTMTLH